MKTRIAFIKFGGLSAGGTERWLQMMAANLPKNEFEIDYYYCDSAPYIGSDYKHPDTDPSRVEYMKNHKVNLIKFKVGAKDIRTRVHKWVDTDFWKKFDSKKYDIVQTAKAGPKEYPYYLIDLPVVEYITLSAGVDFSLNIASSIHLSQWQRAQWYKAGGNLQKSTVIPIPAEKPATKENLRKKLGIPENAIVAGFHQRADNNIYSEIPLEAFAKIQQPNWHFVIKGGGDAYKKQAQELSLKNVHFIEHSGDAKAISEFLNTLDIFAHGRKDGETFGTVFAEAMMHGKPCLSHYSPIANAQPETMGPAGLFAKDLEDYTNKLKELFENGKLRGKLAAKAKPHAEEYYSIQASVEMLANVYRKIMKKPVKKTTERIQYGQSPLGFLYAGDLDDLKSIASHVITQTIPNEFQLHLLRYFIPQIKTLSDIGASGLHAFLTANENPSARINIFPQKKDIHNISKTIFLNNWENRFLFQKETNADIIKTNKEIKTVQLSRKPILLITERKLTSNERALLSTNQYTIYQIEGRRLTTRILSGATSYVCLHKEKHKKAIQELPSWACQHKWIKIGIFASSLKHAAANPKRTALILLGKTKRAISKITD